MRLILPPGLSSVGEERAPFDSWADYYDLTDADRGPFVEFYRSLITDRTRSLLELGCGTGTIAIALAEEMRARAGDHDSIRVVGLDESAEMLRVAKSKDPGIDWVCGDMRSPPVEGRFDLVICPFNTLQFLLGDDDLARALGEVRRRTADDGLFAFDVYQPSERYLSNPYTDRLAGTTTDAAGRQLEIREDTLYDPASLVLTIQWRLVAREANGAEPLASTRYRMRQYSADDIAAALASQGHAIRDRFGDFDRSSFTAESKKQVIVCSADRAEERIPVLRPQLPDAERLLPYLRRIDTARTYTNWGPLSAELERRLATQLQLPVGGVTSAASGTAALVGAILAVAGRAQTDRPLAILPAFTFVATAVAVEQCGYTPYLADIDPDTWMIDPVPLTAHPELDRVGVIVPVAAFGCPVPQAPWRELAVATGVPVAIDGAASFDRLLDDPAAGLGPIPVAISLHATKPLGTGEGGCVASTDPDLILRIGQALNFGFCETRESRMPSINGKMSEYHAAVGLAGLDEWEGSMHARLEVVDGYRRRAAEAGLGDRMIVPPRVGASYVLFRCADSGEADRVQDALTAAGIGHRLWYGAGLHRQRRFRDAPRERLEVTDELAPCLLGIPLAPDLEPAAVAEIVDALRSGTAARAR
jgi:dTDP-4-amino-4,6-dideoxygalactose transaminase/SAM-dependent methyltransferase